MSNSLLLMLACCAQSSANDATKKAELTVDPTPLELFKQEAGGVLDSSGRPGRLKTGVSLIPNRCCTGATPLAPPKMARSSCG